MSLEIIYTDIDTQIVKAVTEAEKRGRGIDEIRIRAVDFRRLVNMHERGRLPRGFMYSPQEGGFFVFREVKITQAGRRS